MAERMNEMSGSLLFRSGVGTQITMASAAAMASNVVDADSLPEATSILFQRLEEQLDLPAILVDRGDHGDRGYTPARIRATARGSPARWLHLRGCGSHMSRVPAGHVGLMIHGTRSEPRRNTSPFWLLVPGANGTRFAWLAGLSFRLLGGVIGCRGRRRQLAIGVGVENPGRPFFVFFVLRPVFFVLHPFITAFFASVLPPLPLVVNPARPAPPLPFGAGALPAPRACQR